MKTNFSQILFDLYYKMNVDTNSENTILNSLSTIDSFKELYEYKVESNLNGLFRNHQYIHPKRVSGSVYNAHFQFTISVNKYNGYLVDMKILSEISTAGNNSLNPPRMAGVYLYRTIILRTKSGVILNSLNPDVLFGEIETLPIEKKQKIENATSENIDFNNNTVTLYTPVLMFFNNNLKNCVPEYFNDDLILDVYTNLDRTSIGYEFDLTSVRPELIVEYHKFDTDKPQYHTPKKITYLAYDFYTERPLVLSSRNQTFDLECNFLISEIMLIVKNASNNTLSIEDFSLIQNSKEIIKYERRNFETYLNDHIKDTNTLLYYNLGPQYNNEIMNMASLDMTNKNFYKIRINTAVPEAPNVISDYSLIIVCKYRNVLQFDPFNKSSVFTRFNIL